MISLSHIKKIVPQLPAIAARLGVPSFRYGDITLNPALDSYMRPTVMTEAHINGFVLTFDNGRLVAVRQERWNTMSPVPDFLKQLVYSV